MLGQGPQEGNPSPCTSSSDIYAVLPTGTGRPEPRDEPNSRPPPHTHTPRPVPDATTEAPGIRAKPPSRQRWGDQEAESVRRKPNSTEDELPSNRASQTTRGTHPPQRDSTNSQ